MSDDFRGELLELLDINTLTTVLHYFCMM